MPVLVRFKALIVANAPHSLAISTPRVRIYVPLLQTISKVNELVNSYDSEKKNRLSELLWNVVDENDYESCIKSPYDGIIITPKDPNNEVVSRAAIAISNLSDIFDIDFCYG